MLYANHQSQDFSLVYYLLYNKYIFLYCHSNKRYIMTFCLTDVRRSLITYFTIDFDKAVY